MPNHPATGFAQLVRWQKKRIFTIMALDWHITIITNQFGQNHLCLTMRAGLVHARDLHHGREGEMAVS